MSKPKFVYVTYIRTTPEKLWAALTDPQTIRKYWFGITPNATGSRARRGASSSRTAARPTPAKFWNSIRRKRLVIHWRNEFKPELKAEGYSRCTMEIETADYYPDWRQGGEAHHPPRAGRRGHASSSRRCPAAGRRFCRTSSRCSRPATSRSRGRLAMVDASKFKPKTVYVTYIARQPEKVWQALTDPAFSKQYFFGFAVDVEPKQGGHFRLLWPDGRLHVSGEVVDWSPPRRFCCSWLVEGMKDFGELPECLVTYDIEPSGQAVKLTMTESHSWDVPATSSGAGERAGRRSCRASRACWRPASLSRWIPRRDCRPSS